MKDAKRVNPKVSYVEVSSNANGILKYLRQCLFAYELQTTRNVPLWGDICLVVKLASAVGVCCVGFIKSCKFDKLATSIV